MTSEAEVQLKWCLLVRERREIAAAVRQLRRQLEEMLSL